MKKGRFFTVGVGPGDPELMTLKAARILTACQVLAVPETSHGGTLALEITAGAVSLEGKTIIRIPFAMSRDAAKCAAAHSAAAQRVMQELDAGRDVAMPNLGDVSIYATGSYLIELLADAGYETVMIPGVPSFCAAAAALGRPLVQGSEELHILPASHPQTVEDELCLPGTKVLMKAGSELPEVLDALGERGQLKNAALVRDCGLPSEEICPALDTWPREREAGYFATIIAWEG